ncbi:MAG: MBL fold metallo-hydrolase [Lentisphaerae bacterium]|nr:MBL fold metallo-hydrolase [Lentisphaerota bacterium]
MNLPLLPIILYGGMVMSTLGQLDFESDVLPTSAGNLTMTFIGHGTLMFGFDGKTIHVDPYGKLANYAALPKADAILITHDHADHLDPAAIAAIRTPATVVVMARSCAGKLDGLVMTNGESRTVLGIRVEAVPAYNIVNKRGTGQPFHPRGAGNGYLLCFGDKRVYVAGDTENTPEMQALRGVDAAFLPMNLPYTMTPEMVAAAAKAFRPKILYPYHYGDTDPARLTALLKDLFGIEVRIRRLR